MHLEPALPVTDAPTLVSGLLGDPLLGVAGEVAESSTRWFDFLLGVPLQVAATVVIGALVLALLRWIIRRSVRTVVDHGTLMRRRAQSLLQRTGAAAVLPADDPLAIARRVQRAETMGSVLRSTAALVVGLVVLTVIANILDWDLGPVLASAGVVGVALGFGAQTLVKDFISGIFMLVEDQYGIGDVVDLGEAVGTVEAIGLRVTQVRSLDGTLWYVRNGEILRVGNMTQGWSRALVEVLVPPEGDVARAVELLEQVADDVAADPETADDLLDEASVTSYEELTGEHVRLRMMVKVVPAKQWAVQRALRAGIRDRFAAEGVPIALGRREVLVERESTVGGSDGSGSNGSDSDGSR